MPFVSKVDQFNLGHKIIGITNKKVKEILAMKEILAKLASVEVRRTFGSNTYQHLHVQMYK